MFETKFITPEKFPLVFEPKKKTLAFSDFSKMIQDSRELIQSSLLQHGALLFRNFPVNDASDFVKTIKGLNLGSFVDYIGGDSPRKRVLEGVYTSTEAPPSFKICLHNELSFVKNFPKHIYFYCDIAPHANGETIIADARKVYDAIDAGVKQRFIEKQLRYVSCYHCKSDFMNFINKSHRSWIDVFETEDRAEVEMKCRQNDFAFSWNKDDWIQISQVRPASISHPITNEAVWFNQAHLFDFNPKFLGWWRYLGAKLLYSQKDKRLHQVFFSDNSKIPQQDLYHIMDVLDDQTIAFPWQKGDVLVLDNVLAMHGRATFNGKRRILTAMTS